MANVPVTSSPIKISAANTYELGPGSYSLPSTIVAQWVGSAFTGTLTPVGAIDGVANAAAPYVAIPYVRRDLAGTASDDTVAAAALTADFIIKFDVTGLRAGFLVTVAAGTGILYWSVVEGPSA